MSAPSLLGRDLTQVSDTADGGVQRQPTQISTIIAASDMSASKTSTVKEVIPDFCSNSLLAAANELDKLTGEKSERLNEALHDQHMFHSEHIKVDAGHAQRNVVAVDIAHAHGRSLRCVHVAMSHPSLCS